MFSNAVLARSKAASPWLLAALGLLAGGLSWPAGAQAPSGQIEAEQLGEQELEAPPLVDPGLDLDRLASDFAEAESVFRSAGQPDSESLFSFVIDTLEPRRESGSLSERGQQLLARSLAYRARVRFNLGDQSGADDDLNRVLAIRPSFDLPRDEVSPKLGQRFDEIRAKTVGLLELTIDPADAEVLIAGRRVEFRPGPVGVLAGIHTFEVRRPGYTPLVQQLEVRAGRTLPLDFALDRISPVLRITTKPGDARILVDGVEVGRTISTESTEGNGSDTTLAPGGGFSPELTIEGLELGEHVLEVAKAGFRTYRANLQFDQLQDYRMPPVPLELERGSLILRDLPATATVLLNGRPASADQGSRRDRLQLAPGSWQVLIVDRGRYVFERLLDVADRQDIEIDVKLRPGLVLLGVLGSDDNQTGPLQRRLVRQLAASGRWTVLDRSEDGIPLAAQLGIDAEVLRTLGDDDPTNDAAPDWNVLRRQASERFPGLLFGLAVLANDLLASHADLWLWSAPPAPPQPDRIRLSLNEEDPALELLANQLAGNPLLRRPWLGAAVIDSSADDRPVIASVTAGGPAAEAGLAVGDRILALGQAEVTSRADLEARLAATESMEVVEMVVHSAQGTRAVNIKLGSSPQLAERWETSSLDAIAYAQLLLLEDRGGDTPPPWVVQFNQAMLQIRAGRSEEAVRLLRGLRLQAVAGGIGTATVDYWLGVALSNAGPQFRTSAEQALTRAAADPEASLYHHDGPKVAPRARLRLQALGTAP